MNALNEYQQRYVLSILSQVSQHLDNVERLLHDPSPDSGIASRSKNSSETDGLADEVRELRSELQSLCDSLAIRRSGDGPSVRWQAVTNLEFASVELQELSYSKLRGYGELDQSAYEQLKTRLDRLQNALVRQLQKLRDGR